MKQFEEYLQDLSDLKSPYYGGSTCMLSLYQTLLCLSKLGYDVDNEMSLCIKLFDEDAKFFDISKQDGISSGDYLIVVEALKHYYELISSIIEIENKLDDSVLIKYLCVHLNFLLSIARCNFDVFKSREDLPTEFNEIKNKFALLNENYTFDASENNQLDFRLNYQIVLPCLKLLVKLMIRKQYSRRGFSNNVNAEYVINRINNLNENDDQEEILHALKTTISIIDNAVLEIKDFSLKNDYFYIQKIIFIFVFTYKK